MLTKTANHCDACNSLAELMYCRATHEHLCEDCIMASAIAYYEEQRANDEKEAKALQDTADQVSQQPFVSTEHSSEMSNRRHRDLLLSDDTA